MRILYHLFLQKGGGHIIRACCWNFFHSKNKHSTTFIGKTEVADGIGSHFLKKCNVTLMQPNNARSSNMLSTSDAR